MRVLILSDDKYLVRAAELELRAKAEVCSFDDGGGFDLILYDCERGGSEPDGEQRIIRLSRDASGADAEPIPMPRGRLHELIADVDFSPLLLSDADRTATLNGKRIKLTSHEYSLLSLLVSGGDNYTSREEIAKAVWGEATDGLINIYVHYLREKLESGGERIILSSRKYGYKINGKYIGGKQC